MATSLLQQSSSLLCFFSLACSLSACAGEQKKAETTIGVSTEVELTEFEDEEDAQDAGQAEKTASPDELDSSENEEQTDDGEVYDPVAERRLRLARAALERAPQPDNQLKLAIAVVERASDLPWTLALENRSEQDIRLAALPELISFEVIATPEEASSEGEEESPKSSSKKKEEAPPRCGAGAAPKKLGSNETIKLPAGKMMTYSFDPRFLCEDEDLLREGSKITLRYGFPLETKKLWQKGKLVEVEVEQKAPFVAEPALATPATSESTATKKEAQEANPLALKFIEAEAFVLGSTYPLDEVEADAGGEDSGENTSDDDSQDEADSPDADGADDGSEQEPPPPFKVTLSPLGTTSRPELGLIQTRIRNVSGKSMTVYIRREYLSYQVTGPQGSAICQMQPTHPAANELSFSRLSNGSSRLISTRLAEACPPGTWDEPGKYTVAAIFSPRADGEAYKVKAYVGDIVGANKVTLTVPGEKKQKMNIAP